ncbi:MAG: sodium-independent anion transporter [Sulfurimonas sp. RIFOXYD12_FULL_33_39]|uniref:SulP family inorganic anion transporter n=1 Tax=unclassified Sulfurimonas TaxID=2623549 RepID=UPI0008C3CE39|nr:MULTISPECIES: SulP family inorganic anion transporter [unclassified Sulfurimonas]OHE05945.1 MAG: sodium-independent anion transporter [Sulfurimonas sp. RIFCSPLOWO2_12_FULL_34_6]OHE09007.1 MAG: sodium-independent anion transporter [Sulfurimonas sp. RIFOXYD12_FULL_33_39]OHE14317.1 MAG: sodium-independent anion transporter [Sulfurimonas sp. RIFOXYD2_FULL_34_21]DAB27717.1 MAG TPA: sodium-independent anion transporter [Sulfurimonas sp. UBA10385]
MFDINKYKTENIKNDILSGLVVAVALVPEAIAFSFIAGVSPIVGLYTAFILGLVTSLIGGKPGMISGATGAVAIVLVGLGIEATSILEAQNLSREEISMGVLHYILLATVIAGLMQISIGVLKLGKFIRLVPQPAMYGFVNGLAIVIASSQFKFFENQGFVMYVLVLITMFIMFYLPKITKAVPSGLVAILALTIFVYMTKMDTLLVGQLTDLSEFAGKLPSFAVPQNIFSIDAILLVLPYAVIVALVGLIESLLTLAVLDEMSQKRGSGNKECIAQGTGNIACGFFGGMAGCAMIGQSIINYTSGGLGRLSSSVAAIGLLVLVVSMTDLLNIIPVAVLVGIMFMVSIGTFEWSSFSHAKHMPKTDAFVMIVVTVITVVEDLAVAVIAGVIISALAFAWKHAKITARIYGEADGTKVYELEGPLFFGSATTFGDNFDVLNDPPKIVIDFKNARVMDSSGVEAIDAITKKYEDNGKNLLLRHLSADCKAILKKAGPHCSYEEDDPTYKVAYNY